ncbi:acyl-coenzyme A amino acid N-acyltransferase 2-like isoform X1 [Corvus moneduloides]|uniref:acyl-coenzyme A amino acid N-acyltransferase 2-like isoform X1 n=1 Tax=Corvus moneduloides TaxID=1196302 RepID=UPI001362EA2D|nr:acyl-coenzyme A amino acid N-acyltransferase 2-like isoform X1 [Corvus moneduloides]
MSPGAYHQGRGQGVTHPPVRGNTGNSSPMGLEVGNPHGFLHIPDFSWPVNTPLCIPGEGHGCELGWGDKGGHRVGNGAAGSSGKPWNGNALELHPGVTICGGVGPPMSRFRGCRREGGDRQEFRGAADAGWARGHEAGGLCPRHSQVNDFQGILEPLPVQSPRPKLFPAGCTMVEVTVTPQSSLADRPVQIRVRGLSPSQLVTLRAWLKDEQGECFQSRAFFRADGAGEVDPGLHAALGGSYSGVWPMGLLWFLQPDTLFRRLVKRDVAGSPFRVRLEVFDGLSLAPDPKEQPLASCEAERWYVGPGVQRVPIREGRVRGALFLPPGPGPFPGVIDLFGGAGGLIEFRAGLLASRGFAVLALAFFAYDDLPRVLAQLDLEYFEEAVELLLQHPKVRGPGLGVVGVSKGAEVALAMAAFLPQVAATVWINGTAFLHGNPLVYKEVRIPPIPYYTERVLFTELGAMDNSAIFADPRDPAYRASAIPVEKIRGKVLFVVGEADRSFNSKLFAELALARMPPESGRILSYPGAGHLIEPPGSPLCSNSSIRGTPRPVAWGGEPQPHARAQEDSWQEILQFLELQLGSVAAMKL